MTQEEARITAQRMLDDIRGWTALRLPNLFAEFGFNVETLTFDEMLMILNAFYTELDRGDYGRGGGPMANLNYVIAALRNGAVLSLSFEESPVWELSDGITVTRISSRTEQALLKHQLIVEAGDSLFAEIPSQTWRYSSPTEDAVS